MARHGVIGGKLWARTVVAAAVALAVGAGVMSVPGAALAAPPNPANSDSGDPVGRSQATATGPAGDLLLDGWGDQTGYHVQIGRSASGYGWSELAVLRPGGIDASSWLGYQCLTGDGRFAAVTVLPADVVNLASARDRGAFAYSIEVATGRVVPLASGVQFAYHSPGCGIDGTAALTVSLGEDAAGTQILRADLTTGVITQDTQLDGQVTSVVPVGGGLVGAQGSALVQIPPSGPATLVAETNGAPYDVRPSAGGGIDFLVTTPGARNATAHHHAAGKTTELGSGPRTSMRLLQGRGGYPVLAGTSSTNSAALARLGVRTIDGRKLAAGVTASSLDGAVALGAKTGAQATGPVLLDTDDQVVVVNSRPASTAAVTEEAAAFIPAGALAGPSASVDRGLPAPKPAGDAAGPAAHQAPPASSPAPAPSTPSGSRPTPGATPEPSGTPAAPSPGGGSAPSTEAPSIERPSAGPPSPSTPAPSTGRRNLLPDIAAPSDANTAGATVATATTTSTAQTPVCAVDRLAPDRQVMQPSPAQVTWAAQMAMQGLLTGSAYARPANFANLGLVSYAPNTDFPRLVLQRPAGETWSMVPRSVYLAIMAQESNFSQASWHAPRGMAGGSLIGSYYGAAGDIVSINYAQADCGYGIGQVTTGMRIGDRTFSVNGQKKVAVDYQENIAAGLQILQQTWNQLYSAGIIANNGSPRYLENWYFAIWAYNSGIQPNGSYNSTGCTPGPTCTGTDGTWGLGWANNPANPNYPPGRLPYLQSTYADAAHPADWAYQERVMGWMASPIIRYSERAYSKPTYRAGKTWLQLPAANTFCTVADNKCDPTTSNPTTPDAGHCQLGSYQCWWHAPVTWIPDCATSCATSSYEFTGGKEPTFTNPTPPDCTVDRSKVPAGAVVVDDQNGTNFNLQGCSQAPLTNGGTFTYAYGKDAAGDPIGAIDTHQLGSGLGGHILFSHTQTGSNPALINTGTWTPTLPSLQYYKVKIHLPALGARATNVVYTINPGGGVSPWRIRVNQRWSSEEWVTIGTFAMQNGGNVVLTNKSETVNTSGKNYADFDVAWDAVAFVPMGGTPGVPIGGPAGIQDAPRGSNPAWVQCGCGRRTAGDPVDTSNGVFSESFNDLTTPGRGPALSFGRSYSAATADPTGPNGALAEDGAFGYGWTHTYNASALTDPATGAVTVVQEDGSRVAFTLAGTTYSTVAPRFDATLTRSSDTYTYTRRGREVLTFDVGTGRLTAIQDVAGVRASTPYATTLSYDSAGQLTTITDPAGRSYTLTWSGGRVTRLEDEVGRTVTYQYDAAGNLTDVYGVGTDRSGSIPGEQDHARFGYDAKHLMTSMWFRENADLPASAVTTNTYDVAQRVVSQTDPLGRTTTFEYGPSASLVAGQTLVTDPSGNKVLHTYSNGVLVSETKGYGSPEAATWTYSYDPVTLGVAVEVDPTGATTTYTYDDHGNRTSSSDALGYVTNYAYNDAGDLIQTVDPNGLATVSLYDQAGHVATSGGTNDGITRYGNLTSTTLTQIDNVLDTSTGSFGSEATRTMKFYYDDSAHPADQTRVVDPLGKTTTTKYDQYGYVTEVTDSLGRRSLQKWNTGRGWLVTTVSPKGAAAGTDTSCAPGATGCTTYRHDAWGNTILTTDPLGNTAMATFDAKGHQLSATDGNGNTTSYMYDAMGQLLSTTRADGSTLSTAYNPDGTAATTTDAGGAVTSYGYDARGRQTSASDPLGRTQVNAYDAVGRLVMTTGPSGTTRTTTYDVAGRMVAIDYSDPATPDVQAVSYDPVGNRTSRVDGTGTSTWSYDGFGALTSARNGAGASVAYGYDGAGRPTSITYPDGSVVTYGYDGGGQMTWVKDAVGRQTAFAYDADGLQTKTTYPNGTVSTASFDEAGRQTSTTLVRGATTLGSYSYDRDANGQLTARTASGALPGGDRSYEYTALNQVASASDGSATAPYGYNTAGDLTTNGTATQQYDDAGQLCWTAPAAVSPAPACSAAPAGATSFTYDVLGRQTTMQPSTGAATTYAYDQTDQLLTATGPAGSGTYTYDADGLRASKAVDGAVQRFTWSSAGDLPLLLADGAMTFIYGPSGLPVEHLESGTPSFYVHDQLGSTVALTDANGQVSCTYTYDTFGSVVAKTGTAATPLQYGSGYTDVESGLIYLRARYYQPQTGSFLTVDPLVSLTVSAYRYTENNPLNYTDPTGLCAGTVLKWLCRKAGSAIADGAKAAWNWVTTKAAGGVNFCYIACIGASAQGGNVSASVGAFGIGGLGWGGGHTTANVDEQEPWLAQACAGIYVGGCAGVGNRTESTARHTSHFYQWGAAAGSGFFVGVNYNFLEWDSNKGTLRCFGWTFFD